MNNKVSVITATYNAERFIEEMIKSVLLQTYSDLELIIVDDCSKDNTKQIIEKYIRIDSRVKYYKLSKNSGAAVARNFAIEKATGRYLAFLDSDDLWDKNKLEKQLQFMIEQKIGFSFSGYRLINEQGSLLNKEISVPKTIRYEDLLKNTIIGCLTVIIDRKIIGDIKMPLIRAGQDTATWLSILKKGYIAYGYQGCLASYRKVSGSISSNKLKALKRTWSIYREVERLDILRSTYYFINYSKNALIKRL